LIIKKQVSEETLINQENTELLYGKLKLFKNKSENISTTDKSKFFRYLPLKRNPLVNDLI